jgi:hypothetical protein
MMRKMIPAKEVDRNVAWTIMPVPADIRHVFMLARLPCGQAPIKNGLFQ